jgi:hypothetical protein
MPNQPEPAGKSSHHSFFPTAEAPSFCSKPTPLVPARDDLRTFDLEAARAEASGLQPIPVVSPSSRPTYVPDEPLEAMLDSGPIVSVETPSCLEVPREPEWESKPPTIPAPPRTPQLHLQSPPGAGEELPRARGRAIFARALFVLLFGGAASLLGYAFKPQLTDALNRVHARVAPTRAR